MRVHLRGASAPQLQRVPPYPRFGLFYNESAIWLVFDLLSLVKLGMLPSDRRNRRYMPPLSGPQASVKTRCHSLVLGASATRVVLREEISGTEPPGLCHL